MAISVSVVVGDDNPAVDATAMTSDSHLDLGRAPYGVYGVKCIDQVSLAPMFRAWQHHLWKPLPNPCSS